MDQEGSFKKNINLDEGVLEFEPTDITDLRVSHLLAFDHLNATLEYEDKRVLENMLNDYLGDKTLKKTILEDFNRVYRSQLKKHLNTEKIISSTNFSYTYSFKTIRFTTAIRDFGFENTKEKGLRADLRLFIENFTTNCS